MACPLQNLAPRRPLRRRPGYWVLVASLGVLLAVLRAAAPMAADPPTTAAPRPPATPEQIEFFERQVRPILVESCWECHGATKQEAGLRLDSRAAILKGSDEGPVVTAGRPDDSRLVHAVRRSGELKMPPDKPLPAAATTALARWVELGLPWPDAPSSGDPRGGTGIAPAIAAASAKHWAFQAVRRPPLPGTTTSPAGQWSLEPIDRFVAERRDRAGLTAAPPAERRALLRRLHFDLTGLPPSRETIDEFLADEGPDAVARLIDRLLAAPAYGEHWGRRWLDVARYADNKGYVFFEEKTYPWAYAYRDYVVESWNADVPYDRFVIEQIAADQLDLGENKGPLRALAFLTIGAHFMNNVHDIIDDRIDVVARGLMGLTVVCARCHDHKYDPVPQGDYYALYGVLRSCEEPTVLPLFGPQPDTDEYRKFAAELATRVGKLDEFVQRKHRDLVSGARGRVAEYLLAANQALKQPATDDFMLIADTNDLNPAMIVRWRVFLEKMARQHHPVWSTWQRLASVEDAQFSATAAELARELAQPSADPQRPINERIRERFGRRPPTTLAEAAQAYGEVLAAVDSKWRQQLDQAAQAGQPAPAELPDPVDEQLRRTLYGPDAPPDVPVLLGWGFLTLLPDRASQGEYQKLVKEVETWLMTGPAAPPRAMVLVDSPVPYEPRVFLRGNPQRLGEGTPRQFLAVANPARQPFRHGSGRLELAREIAAPTNPLTSRVLVNRLWLNLIGTGLARTPGDFGLRSEEPSHPELLDELAAQFVADDWSIKRVVRRIVSSATYGQSSREEGSGAGSRLDPENRWLWRMNARRLAFEPLRDSLLVAADSLDRRIGGAPVQLLGDQIVPRRTLYGFVDRMDVPSLLTTFDFPNPSATSSQRDVTTVTPQALYLMNGPFVGEIATRVAARPEIVSQPDAGGRVDQMFVVVLGRPPGAAERQAALAYVGDAPQEEAWRRLAQALLMTNEFLFID